MSETKVNSYNAFPLPITFANVGSSSREFNHLLIEDLYKEIEDEGSVTRTGIGVHQTLAGMEERSENFRRLGDYLKPIMMNHVNHSGYQNVVDFHVMGMWGNINEKSPYAYHIPHTHGVHNDFTVVYFPSSGIINGKELSDDEDLDQMPDPAATQQPPPGSLVIMDPSGFVKQSMIGSSPFIQRHPFHGQPICVQPRAGFMVILPSYVPHMVTPTENPELTRISISFAAKAIYNEQL